nr:MAG TPA_asm: hypothetical protein [Caudoviricetes sp.]
MASANSLHNHHQRIIVINKVRPHLLREVWPFVFLPTS